MTKHTKTKIRHILILTAELFVGRYHDMLFCFLLAFILSFDSLGIGVAYGVKNIYVPKTIRLIISLASFTLSFISTAVSRLAISVIFSPFVSDLIGAIIFFVIGIYMLLSLNKSDLSFGDTDNSLDIDRKEALCIGIAVSMDSSATGLGLGTNASFWFPVAIFCMQYLMLSLGIFLGGTVKKFPKINDKFLTAIPGIILITLGLLRLFNIIF